MNQAVMFYSIAGVMPAALATGLFVSLCTIQQPDGLLIGAGEPSGNFVNVAGLVNLKCMNAPLSDSKVSADEKKTEQDIQDFSPTHVLLQGWFPAIETGISQGWIAVIDGVATDILGVESDSQKQMTRLEVRTSGL